MFYENADGINKLHLHFSIYAFPIRLKINKISPPNFTNKNKNFLKILADFLAGFSH